MKEGPYTTFYLPFYLNEKHLIFILHQKSFIKKNCIGDLCENLLQNIPDEHYVEKNYSASKKAV